MDSTNELVNAVDGAASGTSVFPYSKTYQRTMIGAILKAADGGTSMAGSTIRVGGWVKTGREAGAGAWAFVEVNDGSSFANMQLVVPKEVAAEFGGLKEITSTGSSLLVEGQLEKTPEGTKQKVELKVSRIISCGTCDCSSGHYPLAKQRQTMEFLREKMHLRPRTNVIGAVARIRSALAYATHKFFQDNGFLYVHTPIITASDCEGAGEMFAVTTLLNSQDAGNVDALRRITGDAAAPAPPADGKPAAPVDPYANDFFGKPAFLTVSGQLNAEYYACGLSNVYTFGPTFRAENSNTARHLAEFWMIEPEIAFCDLEDDMQCAEDYVKYCCKFVLDTCRDDLDFMAQRIDKTCIARLTQVVNSSFKRVTYTECIELLMDAIKTKKVKFEFPVSWGIDLASEHEKWLSGEHFKQPLIVYNYPKELKAFYMRLNDDNKTVAAMDVLVPRIGELVGGSQREERLEVLERRIKEAGMELDPYEGYLDIRKYGSVVHSGFGLGFERLVMFVTGLENIRDVIPFPRWPGHASY